MGGMGEMVRSEFVEGVKKFFDLRRTPDRIMPSGDMRDVCDGVDASMRL